MRTNVIRPIVLGIALLLAPAFAAAHCDTLDGPVVSDAQAALDSGDLAPVLKWVRAADEAEIRAAFSRARRVRSTGDDARELADTWFLETLVRVHRAGEGAPFEGLKPAGTTAPVVSLTDRALATGSADALVSAMSSHLSEGIRARFGRALAARRGAGASVEAGREFVASYVELMHYVERVHEAAVAADAHGAASHDH